MRIALPSKISVKEFEEYTDAVILGSKDTEISGISTDTREICEGDLFVAIKGENFDGNEYVDKAFSLGAVAAICQRYEGETEKTCLVCEDPVRSLGVLAKKRHEMKKTKVVAITGSVGKTTAKEFISAVLSCAFKLNKSKGNFNTEIGMPITMLACPEDAEISVLEMGTDAPGDIAYLASIAPPDVAVVTMIGSSHLEFFKTRENICRDKISIAEFVNEGCSLVVTGDEALLRDEKYSVFSPIFVSLEGKGDFCAENIRTDAEKTVFDFVAGDERCEMTIPYPGRHLVWGAMYACVCGRIFGMSLEDIRKGLLLFQREKRRQNVYNIGKITILDDSYNAAPESVRAAADVLRELGKSKNARTVAVLGDMRELGEGSPELHFSVGKYIKESGVSLLFTLGELAHNIADGARAAGMKDECIFTTDDKDDIERCGKALLSQLKENDIVLVKASLSINAPRVIKYLDEHINL